MYAEVAKVELLQVAGCNDVTTASLAVCEAMTATVLAVAAIYLTSMHCVLA
mgnify:CR=1 FL=1